MVIGNLAEKFSALGWGSGFKLPVSNAVNAKLEQELEQKQRKALQLSSELDDNKHYIDVINNQVERVKEGLNLSQKVIIAKRSEVETEGSLKGISIRTLGNAQEECKRTQKQISELNSRNTSLRNDLRKRQTLIDELVGIVHFDKNALERYKESIEEKENYITFVEQFSEMDKKAIEECKKKYDKLATAKVKANDELSASYQLTVALQSQLDQNTALLRRINKERVEALDLWKATLHSMKMRDEEIGEIALVYAEIRKATRLVNEEITNKRQMLDEEHRSTKLKMKARSVYDRKYAALKQQINEILDECRHNSEMMSKINGEIKFLSYNTKTADKKIASLDGEIGNSQLSLQIMAKEISNLKERYETVMGATMTSEERMKEVASLMDNESNKIDSSIGHLERERNYLWLRNHQKMEIRSKLDQLDFGIRSRKSRILAIKDEASRQEGLLQRKKIIMYEVELEAFQLNNRCEKLLNPIANTHDDEIKEQQEKIARTKEEEAKLEHRRNHLVQEVKHINDTGRRLMKQIRSSIEDSEYLKGCVIKGRLETEKCESDNKALMKMLRDETVEYSLIQVQLKRICDTVKTQRNTLFDLEHEKLLMNSVAKEKKAEMDVHLALLTGRKRLAQEDRSKLKMEITDLLSTLDKLKKKYDILKHTLETEPGDNEVHSEAYYIIKQAEETELLKQEGDLWDARVKEAEKEIIAIQNTLSLIFDSNHSFKESLAPIVESSEESALVKKLQEESDMAQASKKQSDKTRAHLAQQIEVLKEDIRIAGENIAQMNLESYDRKYELSSMLMDLENQHTKIKRANVMSNKILRELGPQSEHERNFIEIDIKYLATKAKLEYALSTLERFVGMYPTVKCTVVEYLHLKDMKKAAARMMNSGKSGTSSAASTPNRSGRGTPLSGKSLQKIKTSLLPQKSVTEALTASTSSRKVERGISGILQNLREENEPLDVNERDDLDEIPTKLVSAAALVNEESMTDKQIKDDGFSDQLPLSEVNTEEGEETAGVSESPEGVFPTFEVLSPGVSNEIEEFSEAEQNAVDLERLLDAEE